MGRVRFFSAYAHGLMNIFNFGTTRGTTTKYLLSLKITFILSSKIFLFIGLANVINSRETSKIWLRLLLQNSFKIGGNEALLFLLSTGLQKGN